MPLRPSPAICGKTNHIQWLRFRPAVELGDHVRPDRILRRDEPLEAHGRASRGVRSAQRPGP